MLEKLKKAFHHWLNPHCEICRDEHDVELVCKTCEVLKVQLEAANAEKRMLLDSILNKDKPVEYPVPAIPQVIHSRHVPWSVKRQQMETSERIILEEKKRAEQLRAEKEKEIPRDETVKTTVSVPAEQTIEQLEKELGVDESAG